MKFIEKQRGRKHRDTQRHRNIETETDKQRNRQIEKQTNRETDKQRNRQIEKQTNRETDKQRQRNIGTETQFNNRQCNTTKKQASEKKDENK